MPEEQTQLNMFQADLLASILGHVLQEQGQEGTVQTQSQPESNSVEKEEKP